MSGVNAQLGAKCVELIREMLPLAALAHVFHSGEILGLYTKYLAGVGLGTSNWAGVVFMFGGLPE